MDVQAGRSNYNPFMYQPMMEYFYNAPHAGAVMQFAAWLREVSPAAFQQVSMSRPDLFDGARATRSGMMGLAGLGTLAQGFDPEETATTPVTQWGNSLLELAKGYMAYDTQRKLLKVNIARAEKGLPPISSYDVAPTLNMGIAPPVLTLGYVAIGGLVIAGLVMAFKKR